MAPSIGLVATESDWGGISPCMSKSETPWMELTEYDIRENMNCCKLPLEMVNGK
jgi:hypothetical protein